MITKLLQLFAAPAIVFTLILLRFFNLPMLADWTFPAGVPTVFALGGSALSFLASKSLSKATRRKRVLGSLVVMIAILALYDFFIVGNAPVEGHEAAFDMAAYLGFFGAYVAFGFLVAEIAKVLTDVEAEQKR